MHKETYRNEVNMPLGKDKKNQIFVYRSFINNLIKSFMKVSFPQSIYVVTYILNGFNTWTIK